MGRKLKLLCKVEGLPLWKGYYYGKPGMAAIYGGRVDGPAVGWGSQVYSLSCSGKLFTLLWWWWIIDIDDQVHPFFPKLQSMYVMGRMGEEKTLDKTFFNETCMASLIVWFQFVGCDRSESKATVVVKGKRRLGSQCPTVLSGGKTVVDNCWQLLIIVDNCW